MQIDLHVKYPLLLSDCSEPSIFLDRVSKINEILNFMKVLPAETQFIHADRPTVGRTNWLTDGQYWQKNYSFSAIMRTRLKLHSLLRNI